MANSKTGLNFFTIDTDRYQDIRIKRLKKDNGCDGLAVYDYILCEIYRVRGYFLEWDESSAFDVAEYFGLKETKVQGIVQFCASVGLFDKALLGRGIITSASIQQRYLTMCSRANRKGVTILPEYNLLKEDISLKKSQTSLSLPDSSLSLPQSKVKESKVKESKTPPQYAHTRTEDSPQSLGGGDFSFSSSTGRPAANIQELASLVPQDDYWEAMRLSSWGAPGNIATQTILQWIDMHRQGTADHFYLVLQALQRLEDNGQLITRCPDRFLWRAQIVIHTSKGTFTDPQKQELLTLSKQHPESFTAAVNEWSKNRAKINAPYNFIKSRVSPSL